MKLSFTCKIVGIVFYVLAALFTLGAFFCATSATSPEEAGFALGYYGFMAFFLFSYGLALHVLSCLLQRLTIVERRATHEEDQPAY